MYPLIWYGPVAGQSGYEVITRNILVALDKLGVTVRLDEAINWNLERLSLDYDVWSRLRRMSQTKIPTDTPLVMHQQMQPMSSRVSKGTKKYIYSLFETDKVPQPWKEGFLKADGIFTFSKFNKDTWIADGIPKEKIHVLPWGIEKEFTPEGKKADILNKKGFTFLTNGDFTERKNFEVLIEAYTTEFEPQEDVCLIIKSHYSGFTKQHQENVKHMIRNLCYKHNHTPPRILFFGAKIATEDMANLYRACDCFVLPSRGEGLGLPVLEAMACGLPVIATNGSALAELPFEGLRIDATLEVIDSVPYITKCPHALNHKWHNVSASDLKVLLRSMYENQERAKLMGQVNAKVTEDRTWHYAAIEIIKVLFSKKEAAVL